MTVAELLAVLENFDRKAEVLLGNGHPVESIDLFCPEEEAPVVIVNDTAPIGRCNRCGGPVYEETDSNIDYPYVCPCCDENKYGIEVTLNQKQWVMVGKHLKNEDGEDYYVLDYTEQGMAYKDEDAFWNRPDEVCYVPEACIEQNDDGTWSEPIAYQGYTGKDILDLCYGNFELAHIVFDTVDWQCPETYLNELEMDAGMDWYSIWSFVRPHHMVYWEDPEGITSGEYTVIDFPQLSKEGDIEDEAFMQENVTPDTIVSIANETSMAEVTLTELRAIEK
jgi:hypothetical protein